MFIFSDEFFSFDFSGREHNLLFIMTERALIIMLGHKIKSIQQLRRHFLFHNDFAFEIN